MNTSPDEIRKHKLSIADYHRMGEAGVFAEHERTELIEGEIFDMPPIGIPHYSIVDRLTERFVIAVKGRAIVRVQNPVPLGDLSEPQPDITLLKRYEDFYRETAQQDADVLLVVEVADSSLRYDRDIKIPLFARHAIPEVWLIDVRHSKILLFQDVSSDGYRHETTLTTAGILSPLALPEVAIDLSGIF